MPRGCDIHDRRVAWIVYCIPWFPAIDRRQVLDLARRHVPGDDLDTLLPTYELHIALGELQYAAFLEDMAGMDDAADRIGNLLVRVGLAGSRGSTAAALVSRRAE